ncbi:MAG TPA: DUF4097 family beta strand repeat-containing protein [Acidimicrobiales bacterium]|nr:MAG: hypothetical protein B7Z69_05445 [Actinobacteria bacterium 21-73-9]HQU26207.1 DUF4097 family beta strand repeat-containing protein [Acidimicrobiales bacterium]
MGELSEVAPAARVEHFELKEGVEIEVTTASGDVHLIEGEAGTVRLTTTDADPATRLERVECAYDAAANRLSIDTKVMKGLGTDKGKGLGRALKGMIGYARNDVDVEVAVPRDARVRLRTASGNLVADATLAGAEVASASGDVRLASVEGQVKVQTASGELDLGRVVGPVSAKLVSGAVRVGALEGDLSVQSVSGDVSASVVAPGRIDVGNVSGDVVVEVRSGLLVELDVRSVSGQVSSQIALDGATGEGGERPVTLKVRSVSGDVQVRRA